METGRFDGMNLHLWAQLPEGGGDNLAVREWFVGHKDAHALGPAFRTSVLSVLRSDSAPLVCKLALLCLRT